MYLTCVTALSDAQTFTPNLRIDYKNNLLTLSAQKADLKNVLLKLADVTGIDVTFPSSLQKQITTELTNVPIGEALSKILEGTNHAIIYFGSGKNRAVVLKVFVYNTSKSSRISERSVPQKDFLEKRIRSYENRITFLNKKLSGLDKNSRLGKRYLNQIRSYEQSIEKLKRMMQ
jgi:type II secretory pathway component GspD/PulD (secretin)